MKKTILHLDVIVLVLLTLLPGCATIFGKSNYPVAINSEPTGATIIITDKKNTEVFKGLTPATVTLKSSAGFFSKAEYQVKLNSPGYAEQVIPINFKLDSWYFGNILIGGVIGMLIVDPATGAMWKLDTPPLNITLVKSTASMETPTLKVIDLATIPEHMRQQLVRIK